MLGIRIDLPSRADFNNPTHVHDRYSIADELRSCQIMSDEEIGQTMSALEVKHQLQHLSPDRHVKHGHSLIHYQQVRFQNQRSRDHSALLLASTQITRKFVVQLLFWRKPDFSHRIQHSLSNPLPERLRARLLGAKSRAVNPERMPNSAPDRHSRVKRCVRILEYDLNPPPQGPQILPTELCDILTCEENPARCGFDQPDT